MSNRSLPYISAPAVAAVALSSSLVVGVLTAHKASLGIGVMIGLLYAPLVLLNLPLGIALWAGLTFISSLSIVSIGPNAAGILIALAWLGTLSARREYVREFLARHGRLVATLIVFLVWLAVTALWARSPGNVGADVWQWITAGLLLVIVATTFSNRLHVEWLIAGFVAGAVLSVVIGLASGGLSTTQSALETATSFNGRLQGGGGDPNYLAAGLIPAIVLAGGLATATRNVIVRWTLAMAAGVCAIGFAAAESRGGLVAAVVAIFAAVFVYRKRRAQALVWLAVTISVGAVWFAASPSAWQRVTSFNDGGNGRTELWHVAWEITKDHPVNGVGLNNYTIQAPLYVRKPGALRSVALIADKPHVVHNTYLQMLAEAGVVGLVLYLIVLLGCLRAMSVAARRFDELGERGLATLSRSLLIGTIGTLAASFFISNGSDWRVWLLLGLGPALLGIAMRPGAAQRGAEPVTSRSQPELTLVGAGNGSGVPR